MRRIVFYKVTNPTTVLFKGDYTGQNIHFAGVATNELYLIKAECLARAGDATAAMTALNTLLQKRWKTGTFTALTAADANDALVKILEHRRKELPFTAQLRWEDLRRLNKDTQFAKTLVKVLSGNTYTLPPNDNRWVYPIPEIEIRLSGIVQNPR
jgi:starch-binding outer membrane protein, SusD/RagB family